MQGFGGLGFPAGSPHPGMAGLYAGLPGHGRGMFMPPSLSPGALASAQAQLMPSVYGPSVHALTLAERLAGRCR